MDAPRNRRRPAPRLATTLAAALVGSGLAVGLASAPAGALPRCQANPLPIGRAEWAPDLNPSIDATGRLIAFQSGRNIDGANPQHRGEVWLHDVTTGTTTRLTDGSGDAGWLGARPAVDGPGDRVALAYSGDPTGQNPDGNGEIFLYDVAGHTLSQVTDTTGGDNLWPAISADGSTVAFTSPHDLDPAGGNADGSVEVFAYDVATGVTTQLSEAPSGTASAPAVDADGGRVAYVSDQDGNGEVYVHDAGEGATTRLTASAEGNASAPSITADGDRVAFTTDADLVGDNPGRDPQVFLADRPAASIVQLSGIGGGYGRNPSISADGAEVAYWASGNVALVDTAGGAPQTVTAFAANYRVEAGGHPVISSDGQHAVVDAHVDQADGFGWDWQIVTLDCSPVAHQPDVLVRRTGTARWRGDDVIGTDGAGQTAGARVARSTTATFTVRVTNDGADEDSLTLHGPGGGGRIRVRYLAGGSDVTDAVVAGTYSLGPLAAGDGVDVVVQVRATAQAATGAARTYRVTATSTADDSRHDTVGVHVAVAG